MKLENPSWSDSAKTASTEPLELKRQNAMYSVAAKFHLRIEDLHALTTVQNQQGEETISGKVGEGLISISNGSGGIHGTFGKRSLGGGEAKKVFRLLHRAIAARDKINAGAIVETLRALDDYHESDILDYENRALRRSWAAHEAERQQRFPFVEAIPFIMRGLGVSSAEASEILRQHRDRFYHESGLLESKEWHHVAGEEEQYYDINQIITLKKLERVDAHWGRGIFQSGLKEKDFRAGEDKEIVRLAEETGLNPERIRLVYEHLPSQMRR